MDIFEEINKSGLPEGQYVVMGGAQLAGHGLRTARDLDLFVSKGLYDHYKNLGWQIHPWVDAYGRERESLMQNNVELCATFYKEETSLTLPEVLEHADFIRGIPFVPLEWLVVYKKKRRKPKDVQDVVLMENYLNQKK